MNSRLDRLLVLSPLDRYLEIVCGLIMVLSFTCALSVAHAGEADVHRMFVGAILCNLTWGIIDAVFYLIGCLVEYSHGVSLLLRVQQCNDSIRAQELIANVLPTTIAKALLPAHFEHVHAQLKQLPSPTSRLRLTGRNLAGALGVFVLVFVSTFPVVVPFLFIRDARLALYVSNAIAIALLFGSGHMLARYAGLRRVRAGLAMVAIGAALVAVMVALGG